MAPLVALSLFPLAMLGSACPFLDQMKIKGPVQNPHRASRRLASVNYDVDEVKADIAAVLESDKADGSKDFFEDDAGGNYGPNFIRLAWHCAGTYRISDGNGGCDGSRIRHAPEKDWGDNKGLISPDDDGRGATLEVLRPIYEKYSGKLSWADLIVLSGNVAIEQMGGPKINFCGGQTDDADGTASEVLNESMIYVDAGAATAADIRTAFAAMGMNDEETIALIAGGHTFGRCHTGRSGFEGAWTSTPSAWSMMYIENLLTKNWTAETNSKGLPQFRTADDPKLMMLVADVAVLKDKSYVDILDMYKENPSKFKEDFGKAWEKLMRGGRDDVCEAKTSTYEYDLGAVKADIAAVLKGEAADGGDKFFKDPSGPNYGPNFIRLAWHCAGTYRETDGVGGCDGARIRHAPEKDWGDNKGLISADDDGRGATLDVLKDIYEKYSGKLSWADLIVLSGNVAIEEMGGPSADFCGGRKDDEDGLASLPLNTSMIYVDAGAATAADIRKAFTMMGMNDKETIALIAGGHTFGRCHTGRSGFDGPWTTTPSVWSNQYIENLLSKTWERRTLSNGKTQMQPKDGSKATDGSMLMMLVADVAVLDDEAYKAILEQYQQDPAAFKADFGKAWAKLMNGGRLHICEDASREDASRGTRSTCLQVAVTMLVCFASLFLLSI